MVSFACPGSSLLLISRPFGARQLAPVHPLKLQMRQGSICALDLLLKEAEKDLFRGFRGDIDFLFSQILPKCTF